MNLSQRLRELLAKCEVHPPLSDEEAWENYLNAKFESSQLMRNNAPTIIAALEAAEKEQA